MASELAESRYRCLDRIVDLSIDSDADALLVAGDVFDSENRSLESRVRFRDSIARAAAAGVECLIVHGNHDPASGHMLSLPEGAHRFPAGEVGTREVRDGSRAVARVHGYSYPERVQRENVVPLFRRVDSLPSIGLLHCQIGVDNPYAPCTVEDLEGSGMDYWALGHVHGMEVSRRGTTVIAYPGTPQGSSVGEPGPRGCLIVDMAHGEVDVEPREVSELRWGRVEVDVTGMGVSEALESVEAQASSTGDDLIDVTLTGSPATTIGTEEVLEALRSNGARPWVSRVRDRTSAIPPSLELREDIVGDIVAASRSLEGGGEGALMEVLRGQQGFPKGIAPFLELDERVVEEALAVALRSMGELR